MTYFADHSNSRVRSPRTSASHPLQIAAISMCPFPGALGVTFAPGKNDPTASPAPWLRDLAADLDVIVTWGAQAVVTLIESHEFELLGIPNLGDAVQGRGLEWLHLPIRDVSAPDARFERTWPHHSAALRARLRAGGNVLVHCRGGLGRAGMIAARLLVEEGVEPQFAMALIRAARPAAIETRAQEDWVGAGAGRREHLRQSTVAGTRGARPLRRSHRSSRKIKHGEGRSGEVVV